MNTIDKNSLSTILVTDCGSTTTKALLFQKTQEGWRHTSRGEAPTTVEEPVADVTVGAINAFTEIEELSSRKILKDNLQPSEIPFLFSKDNAGNGIDLYLSTSSAGGGLQMMVAGVVAQMSTESAERAALGAGAIVLDSISADDGREDREKIAKIRHLKPDIVLITGGVDGGSRSHVIEVAEILLAASPRPRFGDTLKLPVIYAGNKDAADEVKSILDKVAQVSIIQNVRPTLDEENVGPAREAIHEFFLSHVMSHSPGYGKLLSWTPVPIVPTPAAVGKIVEEYANRENLQVLCVDIGGATTDVFSVFKNDEGTPIFNRTVSANLGMSYSVANVLVESGPKAISRWLPYEITDSDLRDRLRNKMIRPTSIPQTMEDLHLEQAVCREALRLSLVHHRSLAVGLSGRRQRRGIADVFTQKTNRYELVNMMTLDVVIGSGGVLSHAPNRMQALLMMLDGFGLQGVTQVTVDSIFMMPHLGVVSNVHPEAAKEIFIKDCLVNLGHTIVPVFSKKINDQVLGEVFLGDKKIGNIEREKVTHIDLKTGSKEKLIVKPSRHVNIGNGVGEIVERDIITGSCGIVLDGRNRPIEFSEANSGNVVKQKEIFERLRI